MSDAEEEKPDDEAPPAPAPRPAPIGRELMDLDLDLDASWPFDPSVLLSASPPSVFLLSYSSSPPTALIPPQFPYSPAPPSPLCLFDDKAAEIADAPLPEFSKFSPPGIPETADGVLGGENNNARPFLVAAADDTSNNSCIIKEKMTQALRRFKESTDEHVLVQVWAPVKRGDQYVLTTSGQPFVLDPHSTSLSLYRTVSLMYLFSVDGHGDGDMGLPGRVFCKKLPEWTPDVQYYSCREYPRLTHALNYNVRGSLALPVFEPSCRACVGVVELIMTSPKINYAEEVDKVCKALEAVNLKSSEILNHPRVQICNEGRQSALAEILEILTVVCETHKLPLAQTWVPCRHGSVLAYGGGPRKSCSSFDGSCMGQICMSTSDAAFYVVDHHMWGFRDACAEHHLQKGQGVAGMAFALRRPCFSRDITQFCKTEYPLVHYARMFGLSSCLSLCLQSSHTGNDDYILEFFLPANCKSSREQNVLVETISNTIRQCFRSLKVAFKSEIQEEIFHVPTNADGSFKPTDIPDPDNYESASLEIKAPHVLGSPQHDKKLGQNLFEQHLLTEPDDKKNGKTFTPEESQIPTSLSCNTKNAKAHERRRGKAEKSISLEVLQRYFAGSLKDAAKSLGVCPTTMKRICRQHGISRWPSRKINKVNRSLSKLKRVIESVQGAEGAFNLTSLATCPLPVAVGSHGWPISLDESQQNNLAGKLDDLFEEEGNELLAHKSSEGDRQSDETLCQRVLTDQNNCKAELGKGSHGLQISSSGEESAATPASQGSCEGSPASGDNLEIPVSSPITEQTVNNNGSLVVAFRLAEGSNTSADHPRCDANDTTTDSPLGGMLIKDSGSSKDLKNLCHSSGDAGQDGQAIFTATRPSQITPTQEVRTVTIKASYKEDIIRFKLQCNAGLLVLKEEVAKRLKLDVGTFDIKYLDDDGEWVLLSCDADLEECLEVSRLSGGHVIRLSVHDIVANLGSSCESSGG